MGNLTSQMSKQQLDAHITKLQSQGFVVPDIDLNLYPTLSAAAGASVAGTTTTNINNNINSNANFINATLANIDQHMTPVSESVAAAAAAATFATMASFVNNDNVKRVLFPTKLWDLVSLPDKLNPGVTWTPDGTRIVVDKARLQKGYLSHPDTPFRTRSVDSFVRQLHFYGFRKTIGPKESDTIAYYYHDYFQRERPELLKRMKRHYKHNTNGNNNHNHNNNTSTSNNNSNNNHSNNNSNNNHHRRPSSQPTVATTVHDVTAKDHIKTNNNFCRNHVACVKKPQTNNTNGAFVCSKTAAVSTGPHNLSTKPVSLLKPVCTPYQPTNSIVIAANTADLALVRASTKVPKTEEKSLENVAPEGKQQRQIMLYTITDNTKSAPNMSDNESKLFWPDSVMLYGSWNERSNQFNLIDAQFVRTPKTSIQQ